MNTHARLKKPDDTWIWIKHRLELKDFTFGKLAKIYGVTKACFTGVKHRPFPKYERIIADLVGVEPWELWPERYDSSRNSNRKKGKRPLCKPVLEHGNKEINGKDPKGDNHETQD
jgi:Ner family transcriptional regulator